jgi:hypothetical protein
MDLLLVRLAESGPPGADTLRTALQHQTWLAPKGGRGATWSRLFAFRGGHVQLITTSGDTPPYTFPGLRATLMPDAEFAGVAAQLVRFAGDLHLGIDTMSSRGALWWPAPVPASLDRRTLDRAIAVSHACESREAWPLLGFALAGPECLELAESHPALAFLTANSTRIDGQYRADIPATERPTFLRELSRSAFFGTWGLLLTRQKRCGT